MALRMDRQIDATELGYYITSVTNRGVVVSVVTAGSGVDLDNPLNVASATASASGASPLGVLLNDFVNIDLTRTPLNWHKDQSQIGSKGTILRKGWCVTDQIIGTPTAGQHAILTVSGQVSGVPQYTLNTLTNPKVGRWLSSQDEAGFARLEVDL